MSEWEYMIISDSSTDGLEREINKAAKDDWEPINAYFANKYHNCLIRRFIIH